MNPPTPATVTLTDVRSLTIDRLPADIRDTSILALPSRLCEEYNYPEIVAMGTEHRKKLSSGFQVKVCMLAPEGSVQDIVPQKFSIGVLAALSPVIKEALESSPFGIDPERLERIVLPYGHVEAYEILFDGLKCTYNEGKVNTFRTPPKSPIFHTYNLLTICQNLAIRHILDAAQQVYNVLTGQQPNLVCLIDPDDIRHAYRDFPAGHPLQKAVVEKVAWGELYRRILYSTKREIHEVELEIKEFHEDLLGRRYELLMEGEQVKSTASRSKST